LLVAISYILFAAVDLLSIVVSAISVVSVCAICVWMIITRSVSTVSSPVWSISVSISIPSIWISISFGFTLLYNMDSSTTVGVVGVWFYNGVGNWGVVVSVWVMETSITTIIVWVGVYDGFLDLCGLSLYNFFYLFFGSFYYWYNMLIVWVPVSVGVWMISCSTMGIVLPRICLGFGLSCSSSEKSENYEKFHG